MRQPPLDSGLDKIGCEGGKRYRHVDFAYAAALARCDVLGVRIDIGEQLIEPTTSARNRGNEERPVLGPDRSNGLRGCSFGHKDLSTPSHWRLAPWHLDPYAGPLSLWFGMLSFGQLNDQPVRPHLQGETGSNWTASSTNISSSRVNYECPVAPYRGSTDHRGVFMGISSSLPGTR
jgi:hypothetical protein